MPIYEYRCAECGFQNEYLQKVSEPPMTLCPSCGKEAFRKLLTAAGFQLKGSGWYVTDFKNAGKKTATKSAQPEAAKAQGGGAEGGAGGESKSDSKTDSTNDSKTESKTEKSSDTSSDKGAASACTTG